MRLLPLQFVYRHRFVYSDLKADTDGGFTPLDKAYVKVDLNFKPHGYGRIGFNGINDTGDQSDNRTEVKMAGDEQRIFVIMANREILEVAAAIWRHTDIKGRKEC